MKVKLCLILFVFQYFLIKRNHSTFLHFTYNILNIFSKTKFENLS